ncbi:MAG: ATP-binding cassette domain-containing protein, partial [Boseongicola sp.]
MQRGRIGWVAIKDLLASSINQEQRTKLPSPKARLEINSLKIVARAGEPPILYQVSLDLKPGEAIGIIGRSGSGKTTLARAIVGLVRPTAGGIRLAGATLDQYSPEQLGQSIGYLPQNIQLFDGTIADNIAQLEHNPDAEKVIAAAQKARVHDIILKLPNGYDT